MVYLVVQVTIYFFIHNGAKPQAKREITRRSLKSWGNAPNHASKRQFIPFDIFALIVIACRVNLVVYNPKAGRCSQVVPEALGSRYLGGDFAVVCPERLPCYCPSGKVLVLGGDGTLQTVLAWCYRYPVEVLYLPLGTLNERSKGGGSPYLGLADDKAFTYVLATGIFCPLGWVAKGESKRRLGRLSYLAKVWSEYRVPTMATAVVADGKTYRGEYALVMLIRSPVCFGLPFNRAYSPAWSGGHLLLIKTTGKDTLLNRARLFFPLFRVFFVGLDRDEETKRFVWRRLKTARIEGDERDWCMDGERTRLGSFDVRWQAMTATVKVICPDKRKSAIDKRDGQKV